MRNYSIAQNREFLEFMNYSTWVEGRNSMPRASQGIDSRNSFLRHRLNGIDQSVSHSSSLFKDYPTHPETIHVAFQENGKDLDRIEEPLNSESFNFL